MVAEVADQGAVFVGATAEGDVPRPRAAHVQQKQRRISFRRRVDLERDFPFRVEVNECGGEQFSGRPGQRRVALPRNPHADTCPGYPCHAEALGKVGGEKAWR